MKKYLKNGLSVLTCVAMCVQSPLAVLAEDATEVQNEMQSETPVVQPTDLQTLDQQIATYANESNQSEIFCTVMGDPNLNKEHIESHTKTFVKVKGDDNKDHYKLSEESQQYVDGIYEIRFNDGCIWKLHFDKNGYLNTGWQNDNGSWYYFDPNYFLAIRDTPYQITDESNNTWVYYFDRDGIMQTEYWYPREVGIWSYFDKDGHMVYGWNQIAYDQKDYQTHYFDSEGIELVGWQKIDGKWYYFDKNVETYGIMETGWLLYENTWYYLKATGEMASDEWVDGGKYYVDANGVYIPGKVKVTGSWLKDNTGWWYRNADGSYPTDKWEEINSKWYHFNTSGYMETGWITTGDLWYHLAESGELTCGYPNGGETVKLTKTINATCTTDGYQEYTCSKCGETHQVILPKTGHNYQVSKKVDATCTADGYDVYTCTNCKDTYTKTTQQKLGHDFSKKIDHKDSTCTVKGYDLYKCSRCDETKKTELALVDHNYQLSKTVKATCTADGYKEYTCSMCNKSYQEKLPKTGHDYDMNTEVERVDSTCSTHGHVNYACKVCGDIKTVELDLNPENHSYTETGRDLQYIYYKCSECGAEKKEFNDQEYTIDLGNGKTTTVVGHFDLEMRDKILEIINEKRAYYAGGIPLLSLAGDTTSLQDAANTRAIEITYSYSHTRPNGNRAITDLYPYAHTDAENLAKGQSSAEQVCDDWFSSPTHNRNIVNNSYRTIGISVFCQKLGEDDYVNNFSQLFSTLEHY